MPTSIGVAKEYCAMDLIPPEILLNILEYIDGPALSEMRLHDEPSLGLLVTKPNCSTALLKAAALVSRSWRSLVLPYLFRHVLWKPKVYSLSAFTLNPIPLLQFLAENQLAYRVATFTMIIDFYDPAVDNYQFAPQIRTADLEWLWDQLFSVIDPLRFTIVARPTTLAALFSRMVYLDDAWSFDIPYHIVSLARNSRQLHTKVDSDNTQCPTGPEARLSSTPAASSRPSRSATFSTPRSRTPNFCPLFTVRPWTSILLNEGSSTKVYRGYEWFLRRPPSILGALLGVEEYPNDPNAVPLIPHTVVDFNYIAIFPLSAHFETLIQHLPRIDRLFVQLTPKPGNGILERSDEMKYIDPADLWMERNTSYNFLMRELTFAASHQTNWRLLRVFESGDAADKEAWEMAVRYLEDSGVQDWKAEREGVFVKQVNDGQPLAWSDEVNGHVGGFANISDSNLLFVYSSYYSVKYQPGKTFYTTDTPFLEPIRVGRANERG
ncbi:hypothetical protein NUW58_g7092 [Xylaria curta]|uniref:Uncharacterized protein n=1 Tax=Xylaria curta TaxID=42375 RepID=A0ACC1NN68_9PEZI|nr:hypothetical protein NUW58_g7092 [Xylaria curta]